MERNGIGNEINIKTCFTTACFINVISLNRYKHCIWKKIFYKLIHEESSGEF